jgi:hypothetical protein
LVKDGENTASSSLADLSTDSTEVGGVGGNSRGVSAVEVGNTQNIGSTALRSAIEASARDVGLSLLIGGEGRDNGAQEGNSSECELHGE